MNVTLAVPSVSITLVSLHPWQHFMHVHSDSILDTGKFIIDSDHVLMLSGTHKTAGARCATQSCWL